MAGTVAEGVGAAVGITGVLTLSHRQHRVGVIHIQCKHCHAVQRAAGGHHPRGRQQADTGLEAHQIIKAGGHTARARRVSAQAETGQPLGHGHRRARAGTATDHVGVDTVFTGAPGRAGAHQPGGKLVEVTFAHRNRPGGNQRLHHRRRLRGGITEGVAGRRGRHPRQIDIVFDGKGQAEQRQAVGTVPVQCLQIRLQLRRAEAVNPDIVVVERVAARGNFGHQLARCQPAITVGLMQAAATQCGQCHWSLSPSRINSG